MKKIIILIMCLGLSAVSFGQSFMFHSTQKDIDSKWLLTGKWNGKVAFVQNICGVPCLNDFQEHNIKWARNMADDFCVFTAVSQVRVINVIIKKGSCYSHVEDKNLSYTVEIIEHSTKYEKQTHTLYTGCGTLQY